MYTVAVLQKEIKANGQAASSIAGEADERGGGFEGARGQRGEVREAAPAGQLGRAVADAVSGRARNSQLAGCPRRRRSSRAG